LQAETGAEDQWIKAFSAVETFQGKNRGSKTANGSNCRLGCLLNAGNYYLCGDLKTSKFGLMNKKNARRAVHG
jgi:hypothetical protein